MADVRRTTSSADTSRAILVIPEWAWAGLLGGLASALVFLIRDLAVGQYLYTPSVLGTAWVEGLNAAREVEASSGIAVVYHVIHFVAWFVLAFIANWIVRRADEDESKRWMPWAAFALALAAIGIGDRLLSTTLLGHTPIWVGGIAGLAACGGFLIWRHPGTPSGPAAE